MKSRTKFTAVGAAGVMALSPVLNEAYAAGSPEAINAGDATVAAISDATDTKQVFVTSAEILEGLNNVRAARLAIFNGEVDQAISMADSAAEALKAVQEDAASLSVQTSDAADDGETYVPFDTAVSFADGFEPTAEMIDGIEQANQYFVQGDERKAIDALKQANVDIVFEAALLPVNESVKQVLEAVWLLSDGAFYQANLALKEVEESVLFESYSISGIPVQGQAG